MSESEESSTIPSVMTLEEVHEMAAKPEVVTTSSMNLTDAQASTSVAGQAPHFTYEFKINYNQRLEQKIGALVNTEMLSDVKLLIGEEKAVINAHKLILALSSPVFTSMFYSPMLESQNEIFIPDCRPDAFQALIQFLYKGEQLPLVSAEDVNFLLALLYVARKYAIKNLEDVCAVNLSSLISSQNVFDVLNAANLHCLFILETECWGFIEDNTKPVLERHLTNMDSDILSLILNDERLNIEEVELFELLLQWIENECLVQDLAVNMENKLKVGEKLLELVRFPTMTATEFADFVVPSGVLKVEQIAKILTYISTSPQNKGNYEMEFSVTKREARSQFLSVQSQASLSGPRFITFEIERNENLENENIMALEEERPRSRRNRRSRRRNRSITNNV